MRTIAGHIADSLRGVRAELRRQGPLLLGLLSLGAMVVLLGCDADDTTPVEQELTGALCEADAEDGLSRPAHWTVASHCKGVAPDYDKLFDDAVVHRFDITIEPVVYQQTLDDLTQLLSGGGTGGDVGRARPQPLPAGDQPQPLPDGDQPQPLPGGDQPRPLPGGDQPQPLPGGDQPQPLPDGDQPQPLPGGDLDSSGDPMWVPVTVKFDGKTWDQVGMRYKGNSSLRTAWQQGQRKLAFRFNFDKFEDDHPELTNQRFYGFKKMTFSNGYKDDSLIRDKLAADIFRAGGIPAARGAFARVYVDFGEGSVYFGLYAMVEDPSDELLGSQFADDSGNLYKPEGDGAKWGTFVAEHFTKSTNEEDSDWSDIEAAFAALHSDKRQSDPRSWRAELEQVFDVDHFLRCLAVNQTMQNWDSYGSMPHNYYVYVDPSDGGRLKWMPWDLNEAMLDQGNRSQQASSVLLDDVGTDWPLIRYLLDDAVYREVYEAELQAALVGAFEAGAVEAKVEAYHALVAPYVIGADGETAPYTLLSNPSAFEASVDQLKAHIATRHAAVQQALTGE